MQLVRGSRVQPYTHHVVLRIRVGPMSMLTSHDSRGAWFHQSLRSPLLRSNLSRNKRLARGSTNNGQYPSTTISVVVLILRGKFVVVNSVRLIFVSPLLYATNPSHISWFWRRIPTWPCPLCWIVMNIVGEEKEAQLVILTQAWRRVETSVLSTSWESLKTFLHGPTPRCLDKTLVTHKLEVQNKPYRTSS